jgi:hypothetical protein
VRHWQWSLDVRTVTYATLVTLHWLQKEGFLNSEECSPMEYSKEHSWPNCNSTFLNENDHDVKIKNGTEKIKTDKNENICDNEDENKKNGIKVNQKINREMEVKKRRKENVEKGEGMGRFGNDYYNRHSEWIINARKYCFKAYGNFELFSDENTKVKEGE